MQKKVEFRFPRLTIKDVKPLLSKDKTVFAYRIIALNQNGETFKIYENKGLDLSNFLGQKMECILEITKGKFEYIQHQSKIADKAIVYKYQWIKRPFEFFPELVEMNENIQKASSAEEDSKRESFKTFASGFFKDWGLNGLDLGIYQAKPLFISADGFFLLNEYEFEEDIELLELNEEVHIKTDEIFLRGIRPLTSSKDSKQKPILVQFKPKVEPVQPMPKEEIPEKKKGRFDSLLD